MPRVSVVIAARNAMRTLPDTLASIAPVEGVELSVCVVDNGSTDGLSRYMQESVPSVMIMRNVRDLGIATAWNQATRYIVEHTQTADFDRSYVLYLGPDCVLAEGALQKMIAAMEADLGIAAVGPKLLKMFEENILDEAFRERVESDHIASIGYILAGDLVPIPRGKDEVDQGQYDNVRRVFAVESSCALVRVSALARVAVDEHYFVTDLAQSDAFFDFCWRLGHSGSTVMPVPSAVAYVYRGVFGVESSESRRRSDLFYGQRTVWLRNMPAGLLAAAGLRWLPRELWSLGTIIFFGGGLRALRTLVRQVPTRLRQRKQIRALNPEEGVSWSEVVV